jgi:Mg/Co/Ni transporter MgtE
MSPRAAWRLETLGFSKVYDYVAGKADWFAANLPREGELASTPRAADLATRDKVTCNLGDRLGDVAERARAAGQDACLVLDDGDIVLGRVRERSFDGDPEATVEQVMQSGPTTTRPDIEAAKLLDRLVRKDVASIIVTTSEGRLLGTFHRDEVERQLEENAEACLCED